jgi:hypothetical protein
MISDTALLHICHPFLCLFGKCFLMFFAYIIFQSFDFYTVEVHVLGPSLFAKERQLTVCSEAKRKSSLDLDYNTLAT